jgi:hypothetical protein
MDHLLCALGIGADINSPCAQQRGFPMPSISSFNAMIGRRKSELVDSPIPE